MADQPNELGTIRQSAVITNYAPGSIVDFRIAGTGASVSVVTAGLEEWEKSLHDHGGSSQDMKRLKDPRLGKKLGVTHFRLPPVALQGPGENPIPLHGVRFPRWLQCPTCHTIKPAEKWANTFGKPSRFCPGCSEKLPGNQNTNVVPVRFVVACHYGHLDDFPWSSWVHHDHPCESGNEKEFKLETKGAGLAGLVLSCRKCRRSRTLENIFSPEAHKNKFCSGARPWLENGKEACSLHPRTLQRGASNLYFPLTESALVIPPWSEEVVRNLGYEWHKIESVSTVEDRRKYIDICWESDLQACVPGMTIDAFKQFIEDKFSESEKSNSGDLRWDEYCQFAIAKGGASSPGDEFQLRVEPKPSSQTQLNKLVRVVSLKEIRAIKGFTRIEPLPGTKQPVGIQFLSKTRLGWYPAIEVRGEGIYLEIDNDRLSRWEQRPAVQSRAAMLNFSDSNVLNPDRGNITISNKLGARYLLLHSLAHILMKQLALQCGYSSASLRERIYVGDGDKDMAGIMIYTSTSDSDGTLGGLQRQGHTTHFEASLMEAVRANEWCSSDPLCIKGLAAATESANLASCHSCLLAPETSCEDFNRYLDRAMLVGTPEDRSIGFYSTVDVD
jgi:hypothetical protein